MSQKTKHLYMTLVEVSKPVTLSDELAAAVGVEVSTLAKMFQVLVKAGALKSQPHKRVDGKGAYKEFVLTGTPYEPPPRKKSVMTHADKLGEPVIRRLPVSLRWRSLNAWLQGDPPIGRSALDGRPAPTHVVLA